MIVKEIMNPEVTTCGPDTTLESAAMLMWNGDCGTVAVVGDDGKAVGIITDRDICMAVAFQHKLASEIKVRETMSRRLFTCHPERGIQIPELSYDDTMTALKAVCRPHDSRDATIGTG